MNLKAALLSAVALFISLSLTATNLTFDMTKYGVRPNKNTNSTLTINRAIEKIASSHKNATDTITLQFAKGRYDFYPSDTYRKTMYISNHDHADNSPIGIILEDKTNFIIEGSGAEFIFHGRMIPMAIIRSAGCSVSGISIDFEKPQIGQITIVENDTIAGEITYQTAPWGDYKIVDGKLYLTGSGWEIKPCAGIAFEPDTRHLVYNTSDIGVGTDNVIQIGKNLFKAPWRNPKLVPGTIVALRSYDRPCPGVFVDECFDLTLKDVTVHYAEGMGLIAQNTHNITLDHFNVCLRGDNDPRYFTTQADATHFSGCSGHINSSGGLYEGMMDDAINVHGTYLKIIERRGDNSVIAQFMHHQSFGFRWGETGDTVSFIRSKTMESASDLLKIKSIEPVDQKDIAGAKQLIITFDKPIPQNIDPQNETFGIENLTKTPSVYFADNIVRNNRARGALFSTPKNVIAERNLFDHTSGTAILLCGDCNGWFETGACHDVTIRNNRFINALTNLFQFTNAVISIYPEIPDMAAQQQYFHSNVTITGNTFEIFDAPLLYARSTDGLIFLDNHIIINHDYQPFHWNRAPIWLEHVNNAKIQATSPE